MSKKKGVQDPSLQGRAPGLRQVEGETGKGQDKGCNRDKTRRSLQSVGLLGQIRQPTD